MTNCHNSSWRLWGAQNVSGLKWSQTMSHMPKSKWDIVGATNCINTWLQYVAVLYLLSCIHICSLGLCTWKILEAIGPVGLQNKAESQVVVSAKMLPELLWLPSQQSSHLFFHRSSRFIPIPSPSRTTPLHGNRVLKNEAAGDLNQPGLPYFLCDSAVGVVCGDTWCKVPIHLVSDYLVQEHKPKAECLSQKYDTSWMWYDVMKHGPDFKSVLQSYCCHQQDQATKSPRSRDLSESDQPALSGGTLGPPFSGETRPKPGQGKDRQQRQAWVLGHLCRVCWDLRKARAHMVSIRAAKAVQPGKCRKACIAGNCSKTPKTSKATSNRKFWTDLWVIPGINDT